MESLPMPEDGVVSIAIICEADADRRTASHLADRILCNDVDWIESDLLDSYRRWQGLSSSESYLKLSHVWLAAKQCNVKAMGHFGDEPGAPDARTARLAFLLLVGADPQPKAVVLVRDTDNDLKRKRGSEQARKDRPWPFEIVFGVAHPKRECWILAGYQPSTVAEKATLQKVRQELGFDPCIQSHELTAKHDTDKKSAKRVLADFVADEQACWQHADLQLLHDRGSVNGLEDFLAEIRCRLIPLFSPTGNRS
jgi:hypothetical protein